MSQSKHKARRGVSPYMKVGRCVYCGSIRPPLTEEHIIPRGLGGTTRLLEAACEECRLISHKFETKVQREGLWALRKTHGVQCKKPQPETIPALGRDNAGRLFTEQMDPALIPVKGALPVFREPAKLLGGKSYPGHAAMDFHLTVDMAHDRGLHAAGNTVGMPFPAFAQMLAKIAHCAGINAYG